MPCVDNGVGCDVVVDLWVAVIEVGRVVEVVVGVNVVVVVKVVGLVKVEGVVVVRYNYWVVENFVEMYYWYLQWIVES